MRFLFFRSRADDGVYIIIIVCNNNNDNNNILDRCCVVLHIILYYSEQINSQTNLKPFIGFATAQSVSILYTVYDIITSAIVILPPRRFVSPTTAIT